MNYRPWGFFEEIFKTCFGLSLDTNVVSTEKIPESVLNALKPLFDLYKGLPAKAMSSEDARYAYMEHWGKFLSILNKTVILVEGFENLDDTSIQTLELYFDKFKNF